MKTSASIITTIALGALLAVSITACNQKPATTPAAPAANSVKPEIVYINEDTVSTQYEYAKDMRKRMEDKAKTAQNDVGGKKQAFQREVSDYQKSANTLSADQRATTEQRLQREGQTLQSYEQNAGAQLQSDQATEAKKLYDRVYDFSKQYAKDNGYKIILTFQNGSTQLLYADKSIEVTADFLKKLNEAYAKEKK